MQGYSRHEFRPSNTDNLRTPSSSDDEFVGVTVEVGRDSFYMRSIEAGTSTPTRYPQDIELTASDIEAASTSSSTLQRNQSSNRFKLFSHGFIKSEIVRVKDRLSTQISTFTNVVDPRIEKRIRQKKEFEENRPHADARRARLRFISQNNKGNVSWNDVERNFYNLAHDGFLHRTDFPECIGMKDSKEFALEMFDALNRRRRRLGSMVDKVNKSDLQEYYWTPITTQDFESRLQLFFDMVDKNRDGLLDENEVKEIIMLSASACKLTALKKKAGEYAAMIMETHDPDGLGYIELWQLETLLLQTDKYSKYSETLGHTTMVLNQNLEELRNRRTIQRMRTSIVQSMRTGLYFLQRNWKRIWVLSMWISIMLGLFISKFNEYKHYPAFQVMGYCLTTAKGAAETLKLNLALILFPVCRNTITWLRTTRLGYAVPFDDNINFHQTIAGAIVLGVSLHAGLHLTCDFVRLERSSETDFKLYLTDFSHNGQKPTYGDLVRGWEGVTGITMVVCMIIAFTLASRPFRRGKVKLPKPFDRFTGFNAFWYSHHLFIILYVCLFIHGIKVYLIHKWHKKTTWMYLAVPVLVYALERFLRFFRSTFHSVRILKAPIYPGDCLALQMTKPPQFRYKSGQYMFVQCPDVSPFQWHPFSITSAPGDEYLSIHVRKAGDWTDDLQRVFRDANLTSVPGRTGIPRADETRNKRWPKLRIDGPYGAPAQNYRKYDVLLLVGLGIGATPFISILKDLINNVKEEEVENKGKDLFPVPSLDLYPEPYLDPPFPIKKEPLKTKAYFYWVTREQGSFEWFKGVMDEVELLDKKGIIEMHNHLTCVYEDGDARSALVAMLAALNHEKTSVDIISGTRVRTHFAKPNWQKVIKDLGNKHPNSRIGVFYCGLPVVAKELKLLCNKYNQQGRTKFEFHKENF